MKCRFCNCEWNAPPSISASLKACPFCGGALSEPVNEFSSPEAVLKYIFERFGIEFMRDGSKLLSCFADLAPALKKEKRMLSYFVECNGNTILIDAKGDSSEAVEAAVKRVVEQMVEELFVSENVSAGIAEAFLAAISKDEEKCTVATTDARIADEKTISRPFHIQAEQESHPQLEDSPYPPEFKVKGRTLVKYHGESQRVVVPDGIRIIDDRAFLSNHAIVTVSLPSSITKIKDRAFEWCTELKSINFPSSLESIGENAFYGTKLTSAILPDSLVSLGQWAFSGSAIESATIPGKITTIPYRAFEGCRSLKRVTIKSGVEIIGREAFDNCPSLSTISFPDTLKTIDFKNGVVFSGTDNITTVIASDSWKQLNKETIHLLVPSSNEEENFLVKDHVLVKYYGRALHPQLPKGITSIGNYAFYENSHIRSVTIPEGVNTINSHAFAYCNNLKNVFLPKSLFRIGERAFLCTGISSIVIPNRVYGIATRAFGSCSHLTEITIPDSVSTVSADAFEYCRKIKTINASPDWKKKFASIVSSLMVK